MYLPKHFEENDIAVLHALVQSHPFAAWVTQTEAGLEVNHLPLLLDAERGEHGTLIGHVARANPIWRSFSTDADSIAIFQGPQAYITPSWYASKAAHGKVVPTWNYAVVHAHGVPRAIEDRDWLLGLVTRLTDTHEAERKTPWRVTDAPADYVETMLKAIVGIEIPIARIAGKWKTSQNRAAEDKLGTIAGLRERGDAEATDMAALVERHALSKDG